MRILNIYFTLFIYTLINHGQKFVFCHSEESPAENLSEVNYETKFTVNEGSQTEEDNDLQRDVEDQNNSSNEESEKSLRGNKSQDSKESETKNKEDAKEAEKAKVPDTLVDALVLVLLLSILATILTILILLMAVGLTKIFSRKKKHDVLLSGQEQLV